ncbi:MAG: DUF2207 domain-containing protein [Armatimonadetes bacterium]|nr:DUF2207 domain-containing protein [Armatimonadota bacterium]MDW8154056.1 DUF2207 domain-containing protein [Armatimonadota bacterium]
MRARCLRVPAVLAATAAVLLWGAAGWAKSYDHPEVEVSFRLLPDGSAHAEEVRAFRFRGAFSWAEVSRSTRGRYGTYGLRYEGVWDADTGEALPFEQRRVGAEEVLRWTYRAQDTTRRFRIRYRIERAVQRYPDVAQFYWQALEGDHAPVAVVRVALQLPQPSPNLFKVFVHSRTEPGDLHIAPDFASARVAVGRVPENSPVEVRVLVDPAVFPAAPLLRGETYDSLLRDERRQARGALAHLARAVAPLLLAAALVGAYVWTYRTYGKEPEVHYEGVYEREPPRPLPPAVVSAILAQSRPRREDLVQGFAATLLEAARLGYLEVEERESPGLFGTGLFRSTDLTYRLTDKGRARLAGRPAGGGWERDLEPFEVQVLEVVFRQAGPGDEVTGDQIEAWGRRERGGRTNFLRFAEPWGAALRSWFETRHFPLDDPRSETARNVFVVASVGVVLASWLTGGLVGALVTPVGLLVAAVAAWSLPRRTPEAALEVRRWEAFRRFLVDFSAMKDAGPNLLPLWETYLVYATALGVAEKLLENLRRVATDLGQPPPQPRWFRSFRSPSAAGGLQAAGPASLDALARAFQNFHNLSRALSKSTRTGGGFGRGGGGGGGGGRSRAG